MEKHGVGAWMGTGFCGVDDAGWVVGIWAVDVGWGLVYGLV